LTAPRARFTGRYGQSYYPIPDPKTGELVKLANVSALAKLLYSFPLDRWKMETATAGVVTQPDLLMLAQSGNVRDACKQALDNTRTKANIGTAVHSITEMIDDGTFDPQWCPAGAEGYAAQYQALKARFGFTRVRTEYTVYNMTLGYAGTVDGCYDWPGYGLVIGDVKTGSVYEDVAYQLAAYALAEGGWEQTGDEPGEGRHVDVPQVRQDVALVINLHDNECPVIPVDLDGMRDLLAALKTIRDRKPTRKVLGKPLTLKETDGTSDDPAGVRPVRDLAVGVHGPGGDPAPDAGGATGGTVDSEPSATHPGDDPPGRAALLKARIVQLPAQAKAELARAWPANVPTFKAAIMPHREPELDAIDRAVTAIEERFWLPVPEPITAETHAENVRVIEGVFPGSKIVETPEPEPLSPPCPKADRDDISNMLASLPKDRLAHITATAKAEGIPHIKARGRDEFRVDHFYRLMELYGEARRQMIPTPTPTPTTNTQKELTAI